MKRLHPLPTKRGRPPIYPEALILTLALLLVRDHASWRKLRYALAPETLSNHPLPALSTLVYRIHTISEERWRRLLVWRAGLGVGDVGVVELGRAGAGGGRWSGCVSFCVAPTIFRTPSVCAGVFEKIV